MSTLPNYLMVAFLSLAISGLESTAYADPGGQGQGKAQGHGKAQWHGKAQGHGNNKNMHGIAVNKGKKIPNSVRFSSTDRTKITNFIKANPTAIPVNALPPGIAMNLARGKPLPPGIAKVFLPNDILKTLPVYPGYEYLAVGNNVVLVDSTTGLIADVLANVLR
jgi:hypothetical protein